MNKRLWCGLGFVCSCFVSSTAKASGNDFDDQSLSATQRMWREEEERVHQELSDKTGPSKPGGYFVPGTHRQLEPKEKPVFVGAELGQGVVIRTFDRAFQLTMRARMQVRATVLSALPAPSTGEVTEAPSTEFILRRMRLMFRGHVFHKDWQYYFQLGFSNLDTEADLRLPLRDAYVTYHAHRDIAIRAGQMKVPFSRQRMISSSAQQFVDRSIVNAELNLDRDVGIVAMSNNLFGARNMLNYSAGVFSGDGRNRLADRFGMMFVGRLEFTPFGHFDEYSESDRTQTSKPRLAIGAATAYNQRTTRLLSTVGNTFKNGDVDYIHGAVDAIFKWKGWSLQGEMLFRTPNKALLVKVDPKTGLSDMEQARDAWGVMGQSAYSRGPFELGARYAELFPRGVPNATLLHTREFSAVVGWYFHDHALKVQLDYSWLGQDTPVIAGSTRLDVRHQVRSQLQLFL